jgi:hypothetical protein
LYYFYDHIWMRILRSFNIFSKCLRLSSLRLLNSTLNDKIRVWRESIFLNSQSTKGMNWCSLDLLLPKIWSVLPKLRLLMLLHFVRISRLISSTPTSFFPKSIFIYISIMTRVYSTVSWRDGVLPRFQYYFCLHYFWVTYP